MPLKKTRAVKRTKSKRSQSADEQTECEDTADSVNQLFITETNKKQRRDGNNTFCLLYSLVRAGC